MPSGREYRSASVAQIRPPCGKITVRPIRPRPGRNAVADIIRANLVLLVVVEEELGQRLVKADHELLSAADRPAPAGLVQQQLGLLGLAAKRGRIELERSRSCRPR